VVARAVAPERLRVEALEAINIRTATGGVVSLAQLATLSTSWRNRSSGGATRTCS
jgi:multidrug efflux pump subunit AcrB